MTSIDVHQLTKVYGATRAVDGLTFSAAAGRVTGFLGPNGAGKSTTMRMILGLDRPSGGTATVGGRAYATLDNPLRVVGSLLDAGAAHGSRTARDHVLALAVSNGIPRRRVDTALEEAGLATVAARRIKTFSLGMRQRLGIAAALLGDPAVVLLDEPSNGLDPEGIVWIRELMRRLAREGRTVLVSSHLMGEAAAFADHLIILGGGRLLADMPTDAFLASRSRPRVRLREAEGSGLRDLLVRRGYDARAAGDGAFWIEGARAGEVGALAAARHIPLLELVEERATLEEAYLDLTADAAEFAAVSPVSSKEA
ncbi:ATP-binding cassette domain-containing protein [Streptomyces sp. NPDC060184]|uniref:ATP-binding cassette domain-containing protein n=1 Tax=Streptomyces sp. NPDC060184 TaxID=3347064 RepID=UPI003655A88D